MRAAAVAALLGTTAIAVSGATASTTASQSVTAKIPLPPPGHVKIELLTLSASAPVGSLNVTASNAGDLGGRQLNSQVIAAIPKPSARKSTTVKVYVFIHRFPAVAARRVALTPPAIADVVIGALHEQARLKISLMSTQSCDQLRNAKTADGKQTISWLTDTFGAFWELQNLVPTNDTQDEEQVDNAVFTACPSAENPNESDPTK